MHLIIKHLIKVESVICCSVDLQVSISANKSKAWTWWATSLQLIQHPKNRGISRQQKCFKVKSKPYVESFETKSNPDKWGTFSMRRKKTSNPCFGF